MSILSQLEFKAKYGVGRGALEAAPCIGSTNGVPCVATPEADVRVLTALVDHYKPKRCLEIGCNTGATSAAILKGNDSIQEYVGVDLPAIWFIDAPAGQFAREDPRFRLIQLPCGSRDLKVSEMAKFDFIFIDGDHTGDGVRFDTELARQLIAPGGIIAWHDYQHPQNPKVREYIDGINADNRIVHIEGTWVCFEEVLRKETVLNSVLVLVPMKPNQHVLLKGHVLIMLQRMQRPGIEIVVDSRGPGDAGIVSLEDRVKHVAGIMNGMLADYLQPHHTHVLLMDADLVGFSADLPARLLETAQDNAIVAPMVYLDGQFPRFYDIVGFVEQGKWADLYPPYFRQTGRFVGLDSVGACYLVPAGVFRKGVKYEAVDGFTHHMAVCRGAKAIGYKVFCDTSLVVMHADLTKYGEREH